MILGGPRLWAALLATGLTACQPSLPPADRTEVPAPAPTTVEVAETPPPPGITWPSAADCRTHLTLLQQGLRDGRLQDLEDTPFALITEGSALPSTAWRAPSPIIAAGGRGDAGLGASRCIIRVGRAQALSSDHRILGREQVRSRYQSGSRREKNPAYEVAKARVRKAEKAAKPGKSSIIKVGDPLMDLVGTVVGSALTGLGQWGSDQELNDALDALAATPASIEQPRYQTYHFERARVRARRTATLPVTLTDRQLQKSWQTSLRQREVRDIALLDGLDRQDEDYARHREAGFTGDDLRRWLDEPPPLPLADMVAGLLHRASTAPVDRVALNPSPMLRADLDPLPGDDAIDAALQPPAPVAALATEGRPARRAADRGSALSASLVTVMAKAGEGRGVYVAPHAILTPSRGIDGRGTVDIDDRDGRRTLGLVAAVDHGAGLALIHTPAPGQPLPVSDIDPPLSKAAFRPLGSARADIVKIRSGQLSGFRVVDGPDIDRAAIRLFLDRHRDLLQSDF